MRQDTPLELVECYRITQEQIWEYARATGANDFIHVDPDRARESRFGSTVAQGLLVLPWLSELMMRIDAEAWLHGGCFDVRFRAPSRPGDTIEACCRQVGQVQCGGNSYLEYEIWCENQEQVRVIAGTAWLPAR